MGCASTKPAASPGVSGKPGVPRGPTLLGSPAPKQAGKQSSKQRLQPEAKRQSSEVAKERELPEGAIDHAQFILANAGKVTDSYDLDKAKLGEGSFGSVVKARHKSTKAVRAVKSIAKPRLKNVDRFRLEIDIMKLMDHPNIIKLYETFEDSRNIYLAMELCEGGELLEKIVDSGSFTEAQAATLMQQIVRAINYMHESKVCHRDLKPENFLFLTKDQIENNLLKVVDFGLSCRFEAGQVLTSKAGTPYYVSPQVLSGRYNHLCDLWSCGVIMYLMLCGYPPFFGDTDADILAKVTQGNFKFDPADWKSISEDAKDLIRMLLQVRPTDRYTAKQALNHVWIKDKAPNSSNVSLRDNFVDNLRSFRSQNKLKKAALHIIAGQLDDEHIKALRETFVALDDNGDGLLTAAEIREGLEKAGLAEIPPDLAQILKDVDSDGNGVINYTEFLAAALDKKVYTQEDACWAAFRIFDRNGDGKISRDELRVVLEHGDVKDAMGAGGQSIDELLAEIDTSGDGEIDFQEFMEMMHGRAG